MMTKVSLCVLALIFCSPVHGSFADSVSSMLGLRSASDSSEMSMPDFAGLIQQRLGEHSSRSPWKAQAEMFLGLLQGMGSQVPENKANQTRHYVDEIIKLLSTSKDDIYTDAVTTKNTTQKELNDQFKNTTQK